MSSESEDEFQSADEGSDSETLEYIPNALDQSVPSCTNADLCERVYKTREDETNKETGMKKFSKDSSAHKEVDSVTNVNDTKKKTDTSFADDSCASQKESFPLAVSELSIIGSNSVGEKNLDQLEVYSKDAISEASETSCSMYMQKIEGGSLTRECLQKGASKYHLEEHRNVVDKGQPKEIVISNETENLKEKPEQTHCKSKVTPRNGSVEDTKPENAGDGSGTHGERKPRAIKQSKIGMKKPREKLGERLGARKLNVNTVSVSKENASCVNVTKCMEEESGNIILSDQRNLNPNETSKSTDSTCCVDTTGLVGLEGEKMLTNNQSCTVFGEGVRENEDEKSKKRQQWEEQQERWHQALNFDKDENEASARDGDLWTSPWGGWGSTLLSAATTFTREVGRGMGTVVETVESSIGAPNPEVLAQEIVKQEQQDKNLKESSASNATEKSEDVVAENQAGSMETPLGGWQSEQQMGASYGLGGFSIGSLVSGVSGALETASTKVLMGGLDTLEVIGRKAMDVIQEGDPGLRKKRAFLSNKKPNLSQVLQEARQRAAKEERERVADGRSAKDSQKPSFEQAWEDCEGPVHLEALSLVAKQCQSKRTSLTATLPHYLQDKLHSENSVIKSTCDLDEEVQLDRDLVETVPTILAETGLPLQPQKLIESWGSAQEKAVLFQEAELEKRDEAESKLYGALAMLVTQLCALTHKGGELALITPEINPLDVASHFKMLAQIVSGSLETMTDQVCGTITSGATSADNEVKDTITNIYLQAATCNNYIQQSLMSLASVLQYSNTKLAAAQL